jgi:hypothetical protein
MTATERKEQARRELVDAIRERNHGRVGKTINAFAAACVAEALQAREASPELIPWHRIRDERDAQGRLTLRARLILRIENEGCGCEDEDGTCASECAGSCFASIAEAAMKEGHGTEAVLSAEVARLQGEAAGSIFVPAFTAEAAVESVARGDHYRGQRDDRLLAKGQAWYAVRITAGKAES